MSKVSLSLGLMNFRFWPFWSMIMTPSGKPWRTFSSSAETVLSWWAARNSILNALETRKALKEKAKMVKEIAIGMVGWTVLK